MIPTLASMFDHRVETMVPWVVSGFLEAEERVVVRRIEVVQTLCIMMDVSVGSWVCVLVWY